MSHEQHEPSIYQGPARALIRLQPSAAAARRGTRAVIYLRVSTPSQVNTDYDPEGISIPAQRKACKRKAEEMNLSIIREYVEPGRSATRMDQRPVFRQMLDEIKSERDVDYVIVYELSRMNRNRVDDAIVLMNLRKYGVTLVSATESIDDSPVGQLVHGLLATVNEFRSSKEGADIRYKMGEKARKGGTLGLAPLGYLNVREDFEGREVRSVAIDDERAPFVKLAFELYATGEYTIQRIAEELNERGLRGRRGRRPAGPVSKAKVATMLRNPYYCGIIVYDGELYRGRHEPLISEELFEKVQQVFDTRATAGERHRKFSHYLKGSVWCGLCHRDGENNRLVLQHARGNGGEYLYFYCAKKTRGGCSSHYEHTERIEDAVERRYATVHFDPWFSAAVRAKLHETLADQTSAAELLRDQITARLTKLDKQEENLYDLASEHDGPKDKLRSRLNKIATERTRLQEALDETDDSLAIGAATIDAALKLLDNPLELYRQSGPKFRRTLNQAIFDKLYVYQDEVTDHVLREPFADLIEAQIKVGAMNNDGVGKRRRPQTEPVALTETTNADLWVRVLSGHGSYTNEMVEMIAALSNPSIVDRLASIGS